MPLAFHSLSHGTVAFGFYNIETDGMLLDRLFFFCTDFCRAACQLERLRAAPVPRAELPGYEFDDPGRIGDLMGAIHGVRHVGYLGELYRQWPFPASPEAFRQHLGGEANRETAETVLKRWAKPVTISLVFDSAVKRYSIGPYLFDEDGYSALLVYVWRGGYPTWEGFEEGRRPSCVAEMVKAIPWLAERVGRGEESRSSA